MSEGPVLRQPQPQRLVDVVDVDITSCYRRDRYRVVTEFDVYYEDGTTCYDRGIVTATATRWRWRQYATDCS
jgi:hypothetical protein